MRRRERKNERGGGERGDIPEETRSEHHRKVIYTHPVDGLMLRDVTEQLDDEAQDVLIDFRELVGHP